MTTAGPNSPAAAVNNTSIGAFAWSSVTNVLSSNNSYALGNTAGSAGTQNSNYLLVSDFGFAIPTGSTILGIVVSVESYSVLEDGPGVSHYRGRIVKAGTIGSTDKTMTWSGSEASQNLGGASDLWGETWTAEDINDSTTGFAIAVTLGDGGGANSDKAYIDHITMTVDYTPPSSTLTSEILRPIDGLESDAGNPTWSTIDDAVTQPTSPGDASYATYSGTTTATTIEKLLVEPPTPGYTIIGAKLWILAHAIIAGSMHINTIRIKLNGTWYDLGWIADLLTTSPQWFSYELTGLSESTGSDDIGFEWGIGDSVGTPGQSAKIDVAYLELTYPELEQSSGFLLWF